LLVCINYNFYKETEVINDDFQNILPLEQWDNMWVEKNT
jgi:hypothetical protein